jgi:hypothetical protein
MPVNKSAPLEKLVCGGSQCIPKAEYGAERAGTGAQVRDFAEKFEAMFLGLQRVFLGVAVAQHLNVLRLDFYLLAAPNACHKNTGDFQTGARRDTFEQFGIRVFEINHHLDIIDGTTVIKRYKTVAAEGAHPTHYGYFLLLWCCCQQFFNLYSFVESHVWSFVAAISNAVQGIAKQRCCHLNRGWYNNEYRPEGRQR